MWSLVRSALAMVVGVVVAFIVIVAAEMVNSLFYPLPAGTNPSDPEAIKRALATMPPSGLFLVLAGYALGTFSGALLAAAVAERAAVTHGLIIGVLFLAAGIANMVLLPHPWWFCIASVAVFLPAAYLGAKLVPSRKP